MIEYGERIARTETRLEGIVDDIREIKEVIKEHAASVDARLSKIETTLSEAKGGWRVIVWIGGAGGGVGSAVTAWLLKATPLARFFG